MTQHAARKPRQSQQDQRDPQARQGPENPPARQDRGQDRLHRLTFNTDGRPHPLQNTLMALSFVLGVIAVCTAGFFSLHITTAWTGVAGVLAGGLGLFLSETTAGRFGLIIALGLSGVGFYLGVSRGGLV